TLKAIDEGASWIDGAAGGLGAGAGNAATELLVAVCEQVELDTGIDVLAIATAAEKIIETVGRQPAIDRRSILLGLSGVASSFLLHAEQAGERYGVSEADI